MRKKVSAWCVALTGIFFLLVLLSDTKGAFEAAERGLTLFGGTLLPSLLPFLMAGQLIIQSGAVHLLAKPCGRIIRRFFRLPGEILPIFLLSVLSGYPAGAKMLGELRQRAAMTRNQFLRAACLCSHAGPAFTFGTLGTVMLGIPALGRLLWLCHLTGSLAAALVFSFLTDNRRGPALEASQSVQIKFDLPAAMSNLIHTMGSIACLTLFFSIVIHFLQSWQVGSFFEKIGLPTGAWMGIVELSRGCSQCAADGGNTETVLIWLSFLLGFGGLSVWLQSLCFLPDIPFLQWGLYKILQGAACAGTMALFLKARPLELSAFAQQSAPSLTVSPYWSIGISAVCLCLYGLSAILSNKKADRLRRARSE